MCLLWSCNTNLETLQTCSENFVQSMCTSNLKSDKTIRECCVNDSKCRSTLIDTTYQTLRETEEGAGKKPDMQKYFSEVYARNKWGTASDDDGGPTHIYSGDGASAEKCLSLIDYINDNLIEKKTVLEMGCGDMRVAQKLDFSRMVSYTCVDVAPVAVEEAKKVLGMLKQCRDNENKLKCHAFQGDGSVELPPADLLLVKDVLMHWPTTLISSFTLNILTNFHESLLTFTVAEKNSERPSIIPGEFAALSLADLALPAELIVSKMLENVCEDKTKRSFFIVHK